MRPPVSMLTQSRYFSPAFNSAIFDGPLRIYFAQYQEQSALKVYFASQNKLKNEAVKLREIFRKTGLNIFVMVYPSKENFEMSFAEKNNGMVVENMDQDFVIGLLGPIEDERVDQIAQLVHQVAREIIDANQVALNLGPDLVLVESV